MVEPSAGVEGTTTCGVAGKGGIDTEGVRCPSSRGRTSIRSGNGETRYPEIKRKHAAQGPVRGGKDQSGGEEVEGVQDRGLGPARVGRAEGDLGRPKVAV